MSVFSYSNSPDTDSVSAVAPNFTRNALVAFTALTAGTVGAWCVVAPPVSQALNVVAAGVLYQAASSNLTGHIVPPIE